MALKVWGSRLGGHRVVMNCDNEAVVQVLTHGRSRDKFLQGGMRKVAYLLARNGMELHMRYIPSALNRLPDLLSRFYERGEFRSLFFGEIRGKGWRRVRTHSDMLKFAHTW